MKKIWSRLKASTRWLVLGGTLLFLTSSLVDHFWEVAAIRISPVGWALLIIALGITLLAHTWAAWVWTWILRELNQRVRSALLIQIYLKTNIGKYLPGNVWHYYGRAMAAKATGISASTANLSVLLEPLLMAAAALIIILATTLWGSGLLLLKLLQLLSLAVVLVVVHPRFLNPVISLASRVKAKKSPTIDAPLKLSRYPFIPLLGEFGFLGLRCSGFMLTLAAFQPFDGTQVPLIVSAFSFAWLLGLVVPGAPGGLGVFEATAIGVLQQSFSSGTLISALAVFRLVSIIAEAAAAGLAWLDERR